VARLVSAGGAAARAETKVHPVRSRDARARDLLHRAGNT
jgi:hypothetical protein